ncbi:Fungal trans [Geosmithia morbida]|uniref:Fungal trans n=1 Tax=Geosmithia morbida TaxID=1094350 RepID=A0A9P4YSF8_9HYPO|nr:Fungal trans [Geosmithia morbida]KAF4120883.1 Fungal trans [Geosmithia morbida]
MLETSETPSAQQVSNLIRLRARRASHTKSASSSLTVQRSGLSEDLRNTSSTVVGHRPTVKPRDILACDRCRISKKKCSRTFPVCTLCATAGKKCSFSTPTTSSAATAHHLRARVEWLTRHINKSLPAGMPDVESINTGSDLDALIESASGSSPPPANEANVVGEGGFRSSGAAPSILFNRQSVTITSDEECSVMPGHLQFAKPVVSHGGSLNSQSLPRDAIARKFVDAYFRNTNRAYPFVDRTKILRRLETVEDIRQSPNDAEHTLLYLIAAIGCTTLQRAGEVPSDTTSKFDIAYASIIQECLVEEDVPSIQILLLLALYSLFDADGAPSWSIIGIVSRKALVLGLGRKTSETKDLSATDIELRHRLFWSIYVFDRMMSISLGYSVALIDENVDIALPSLTIDEFASTEKPYYASILQTNRHVIQLRQLEDRILRDIHLKKASEIASMSRADRRAIQQDIRASIEGWYNTGCLVSSLDADNLPIHSSVTWQSARYYHLLILLYYPCHFNSSMPIHTMELLRFAQNHLQSTSALFQQRQLPLNRVTLCRIFPVGLVLLHCFATSYSREGCCSAREDIAIVINILEAFSQGWTHAHRAAHIFRQFMAMVTDVSADGPFHLSAQSYGSYESVLPKDLYKEMLRSTIRAFLSLMQEVLGPTTCYCFYNAPDERDTDNETVSNSRHASDEAASFPYSGSTASYPSMHDAVASSLDYSWESGEFTFI